MDNRTGKKSAKIQNKSKIYFFLRTLSTSYLYHWRQSVWEITFLAWLLTLFFSGTSTKHVLQVKRMICMTSNRLCLQKTQQLFVLKDKQFLGEFRQINLTYKFFQIFQIIDFYQIIIPFQEVRSSCGDNLDWNGLFLPIIQSITVNSYQKCLI